MYVWVAFFDAEVLLSPKFQEYVDPAEVVDESEKFTINGAQPDKLFPLNFTMGLFSIVNVFAILSAQFKLDVIFRLTV